MKYYFTIRLVDKMILSLDKPTFSSYAEKRVFDMALAYAKQFREYLISEKFSLMTVEEIDRWISYAESESNTLFDTMSLTSKELNDLKKVVIEERQKTKKRTIQ